MSTIVGVTGVTRGENAKVRQVVVAISSLAYEALTEDGGETATPQLRMQSALRCYLGDRDGDRPAWPYPGFLRGSETLGEARVELEVPEGLWADFEAEAARQDVTVDQLAEHAAFYLAAELVAGRVTQRILDDAEEA